MATEVASQDISMEPENEGFLRGLGLWDSTMIVAGSMIGSGIFIVSADIARQVGSPGWLIMTWVITGLLTIFAALSYGELAAMMPKAGGQYVYLRESYSPMWGFLYGWTLFMVIQTGTIAAVGVGFARFLGVLVPAISKENYILEPMTVIPGSYAISLSTQQLVAILLILLLTIINTRGLKLGKMIQNVFTSAKTLSLLALVVLGIVVGMKMNLFGENFGSFWTIQNAAEVKSDISSIPTVSASAGIMGLIVALCVSQVGSLFSSDAWNNITFTAGEVKDPKRNIPLSLAIGTGIVIGLYILANVAYLGVLSLEQIKTAADDRVGTAALEVIFGGGGAMIMAIAIIISTFGCNNGLILAGARVYYAMAKDKLFFKSTGTLNKYHVPEMGLVLQCIWACFLVLPRTIDKDANGLVTYGNLYGQLLDYVIFAALMFYVLTIIGIFILRKKRPDAERPYKAFGYPFIPALYVVAATLIMLVLLFYRTKTALPGLVIVAFGVIVYFVWRSLSPPDAADTATVEAEEVQEAIESDPPADS